MATYTVKGHSTKRENIEGKQGGVFKVFSLTLENDKGVERQGIEWFTKQTTPAPEIGSKLEGEVTKNQYGLKFKKAYKGNGGGFGGRGMSDEDIRRITRSHSQEMALRYVAAQGMKLSNGLESLRPLIDWFDADVAGKPAPTQDAPGFAPTSDVPADTSDFEGDGKTAPPEDDDIPF